MTKLIKNKKSNFRCRILGPIRPRFRPAHGEGCWYGAVGAPFRVQGWSDIFPKAALLLVT